MKKGIIIGVVLFLIIALFFLLKSSIADDKPFNQVILSENNFILNNTNTSYYDTVLSVGLDLVGINGATIQFENLSESAKSQFDGELKAHIRYYNNIYYLFIDNTSREESIQVIAHEIIHMIQYNSGQLKYDNQTGIIEWNGEQLTIETTEYDKRPWETDAFQRDNQLSNSIRDILYN
jgi:hypothetical protein